MRAQCSEIKTCWLKERVGVVLHKKLIYSYVSHFYIYIFKQIILISCWCPFPQRTITSTLWSETPFVSTSCPRILLSLYADTFFLLQPT